MQHSPFEDLDFDRRMQLRLSPRATWLLTIGIVYLLAWWLLPASVLFWVGLALVVGLAWGASYSHREVLHVAMTLLRKLENL